MPFHELRHSAASQLIAEGVELVEVSRLLDHSGLRITANLCGHLLPQTAVKAARIIGQTGAFVGAIFMTVMALPITQAKPLSWWCTAERTNFTTMARVAQAKENGRYLRVSPDDESPEPQPRPTLGHGRLFGGDTIRDGGFAW